MAHERNITKIVQTFKKLDDEARYWMLTEIMRGDAEGAELAWRARLMTALERGKVYPKEKYENPIH